MTARRLSLSLLGFLAVCAVGTGTAVSRATETHPGRSPEAKRSTPEHELDRLESMIKIMERIARPWERWRSCITEVPVSEYGDADHRSGFLYDERDGAEIDHRPALSIDATRSRRRPSLVLFEFAHRPGCRGLGQEPTQPGTPGNPGTADPAKLSGPSARSRRASVGSLEKRLGQLEDREARLERMSEQFDEWESCLSWVPVTEYGDPNGAFGFLYEGEGGGQVYRPALAIDRSELDDPDYVFLGGELSRLSLRRGGDETVPPPPPPAPPPLRRCDVEPGEAVDRPVPEPRGAILHRDTPAQDRLDDLKQDLDSFREDVTDLGEPVEEFATFDQCMYLIGVAQHGSRSGAFGYSYGNSGRLRPALAMDMRGFNAPQHEFFAFPGEEPPSIECNEDAGGLFTN